MCVLLNTSRVWDRAKHCNILAILYQFVTFNLFPWLQHNHIWKSDKNLHDCILHPWLAVYWNTSTTLRGNNVMTNCLQRHESYNPKKVETIQWKTGLSYFKLLLVTPLWDTILIVVPPSFEHGLVLLALLIRGGGGSQTQGHIKVDH